MLSYMVMMTREVIDMIVMKVMRVELEVKDVTAARDLKRMLEIDDIPA